MHPPKISTFDVPGMVNIDNKGTRRAVDVYTETPFGLYMSRAMVARPTAHWMESWLLPDLGICVTDWWWNPGHERAQDYYLDVCSIARADGRYVLTDYYLDLVVIRGEGAEVIDVDEFSVAVRDGLLDAGAAEAALRSTFATVRGLAANGHDLDAWLATHGITLSWRPREQL